MAKNVIIMIGDGMGWEAARAAAILQQINDGATDSDSFDSTADYLLEVFADGDHGPSFEELPALEDILLNAELPFLFGSDSVLEDFVFDPELGLFIIEGDVNEGEDVAVGTLVRYDPEKGGTAPWDSAYYEERDNPPEGFDKEYIKSFYPDSANTASTLYTGVKSYNAAISKDIFEMDIETILEYAHSLNKSAGVVSSVPLNHATPGVEVDGVEGMVDQSHIHTAMIEAITPEPPESRIDEILEIWEDATIPYVSVVAHRGGYYRNGETVRPENSISSIENSIILGAEMVELDVQKSADGQYVIIHDETVDRTTTGTGRVDELTLAELKELNLIVEDTGVITPQKIPTLEEAFAAVDDQIMFNVDIKLPLQDLVNVMNIARDMGVDDQVVIKNRVNNERELANVKETLSQLPFPVQFMPIIDDRKVTSIEFIETVFEELNPNAAEMLVRPQDGSTEPTDDPGFLFSEPVKEIAAEYDVRLWINTLFANPNIPNNGFINGFRNDVLALSDPEATFGFWAEADATFMQTDESLLALDYLNENGFRTLEIEAQAKAVDSKYRVQPLFTVGETINDYTPPGILDGLGAFELDEDTVRVLANHELNSDKGYAYGLANGTELTGARVSYFDINKETLEVEDAGLAFNIIKNRQGDVVKDSSDLEFGGLNRFCSAQFIGAHQFGEGRGLTDDIFFTGEEAAFSEKPGENGGGTEFALDIETNTLYALPRLGRAAFENVTELDTGDKDTISLLIGDDRAGASLLLYVGHKNDTPSAGFLARNGLADGQLYVWVAEEDENGQPNNNPEDFNGTGNSLGGQFVEIDYYRPELAGTAVDANGDGSIQDDAGYDQQGFATQFQQDALGAAVGAFRFSRPEDVAANPQDGTQAVLASTGRGDVFPSDNWGTTYTIDIDFGNHMTADINILYDGDDAGNGQFEDPDFGLRSADNLDWADNGKIYVQEDRSTTPKELFGATSGEEASIWEINPLTGHLTRIAQINRDAVLPEGQSDSQPDDLGNWESSGILDVSHLFDYEPGSLSIFDVQAHSVGGGAIESENLVEGGQLAFLINSDPTLN